MGVGLPADVGYEPAFDDYCRLSTSGPLFY